MLTLQEGDPPAYIESKMKWFGSAFDRAFTMADTIQVISTFLGAWATRKGFPGKPLLIPNAVNTEHFMQTYTPEELRAVRKGLNILDDDFVLVTTSRLVKKNAVDDIIRAIALLPERVKFLIYGTGPDEAMLKKLAAEKEVSDRVIFAGHITHEDMPKCLKACDAFIRPSRSEGMGISFIEAMAAEVPVIATQEGGIADFLYDAGRNPDQDATGWAVDADAPAQIVEAVKDVMDHPDIVERVRETARAMVIERYNWETIAKEMEEKIFAQM